MSMSAALNNALSGLGVVGRSAQIVSSNIANALTPGYGRRELMQSSSMVGGVQVDGVRRAVNPAILSDRRLADAEVAQVAVRAGFLEKLQSALGAPGDSSALTGRLSALEGRLLEAASRPDSGTRLHAVVDGAKDLVGHINSIGNDIQAERLAADQAIARDVQTLNQTLFQIGELNTSIVRLSGRNGDVNALQDQRQILIDQIARIVPIQQIPRDRGMVALITTQGQILLDHSAAQFAFTPANAVAATSTLAGGELSGLTLNGQPVAMHSGSARLDGGRLAANFELRDILAPKAQHDIDSFARDLIERFSSPGLDPTLAPGQPGLFTDAGGALAPAPAPGLAQRLSMNSLADPAQGGLETRLRDGLGALVPGAVGDASLLQSLFDTLMVSRPISSGSIGSSSMFASELLSQTGGALFRAEQTQTFTQNRANALWELELAGGVDTDVEMQNLLSIEQAYAANARVIQAVDDMMRRLLEI